MIPTLSNYLGLWALLGIPIVLVIHLLQQRSRTVRTSTLFLLEALTPESRGGRRFDKLRMSRAFWLQIAAVLLATWLLVQPRWIRNESAQVVVAVLDDSASMHAFHGETQRAVDKMFSTSENRAARTDWVVMTSNPRQPILYRGTDKKAALATITAWKPISGTHETEPALQLARSLAGKSGVAWFFTDRRGRAPADQPTIGVGRPFDNAGFAGARVFKDATGAWAWRALVRNFSDKPLARDWWLESGGQKSPVQHLEISAGGIAEITAQFPSGADACELALTADSFPADDRLPIVKPIAKRLSVSMEMNTENEREFFDKLARSVDGVTLVPRDSGALRLADATASTLPQKGAALYVARPISNTNDQPTRTVKTAPIAAEPHPLTTGLNWQGFLGTGAAGLRRAEGADVLLWQEGEALAWVTPDAGAGRQLFLNFDWDASNAGRLPSFVLLLRRFIEETQDAQPGGYTENFDTNAPMKIATAHSGRNTETTLPVILETQQGARTLTDADVTTLRAPTEAGFFTVKRGDTALVRGAAQFADTRQGDFRNAESFTSGAPDADAERRAWMRNSRPDPLANVWLLAIGGALLWSWMPRRKTSNESKTANQKKGAPSRRQTT